MGLQGHRGLTSACALTKLCAEMRPPAGFAEQRAKTPGTATHLAVGEALDDANSTASSKVVAAMLEQLAAISGNTRNISEIFDECMKLSCKHRNFSNIHYKMPLQS
eukprot:CAMPEP_0170597138 /NCGR_PEP_ID=MMETSP0224-20130122/15543_1 /TAXON_ID=285029 /ORGANISM="Togula jolla, Strain CCCM 725" /LENGTH=105 /DNA_ID=CAMNT_0010921581 /DNA_START=119 /DNA_END=436 /DNA_ORIENTATION=+